MIYRLRSAAERSVQSAGGRLETLPGADIVYGPGRVDVQNAGQITRAEVCAACAAQGGDPSDHTIPACRNCDQWSDGTFCNGKTSSIGYSWWYTVAGTHQGTPFGQWLFARADWVFDQLINPPRCLGANNIETLTSVGGNTFLNRERWIDTGLLGIGAIVTAREIIL